MSAFGKSFSNVFQNLMLEFPVNTDPPYFQGMVLYFSTKAETSEANLSSWAKVNPLSRIKKNIEILAFIGFLIFLNSVFSKIPLL